MIDIVQVQVDSSVQSRAHEVRTRLLGIQQNIESGFLDMCDLLLEAQEGAYHTVFGFARFGDWITKSSGLDVSERQALYYVNIGKKARKLGIRRDQLEGVKISKLKEIFALDPGEHGPEMRKLLSAAGESTLEEVKEQVGKLRAKSGGTEEFKYVTLKLDPLVKEMLDEAVDLARDEIGDKVIDGEIVEPSFSLAVEYIAADFIQGKDARQERV